MMTVSKEKRKGALQRQVGRLDLRLSQLQRKSSQLSWVRLAVFTTGLLLSGVAWYISGWPAFWFSLGLTLLVFGGIVYQHRQLNASVDRYESWRQIKRTQLARMDLDWNSLPGITRFSPRYDHPFEADLDLVGEYSLHRLLDTAVSLEGSRILRQWLTDPVPQLEQVQRRQQLVQELIPRSLFRDKLTLNASLATGARKVWEVQRLTGWLEQRDRAPSLALFLALLSALALTNLVLLVLAQTGMLPTSWAMTGYILYFGLLMLNARFTGSVFQQAVALQAALQQLKAVFQHLERSWYRHTPHLQQLCAPFREADRRPSRHLGRITRVTIAAGLRQNPIMWILLNFLFPWDLLVAFQLDRLRAELSKHAPVWMAIWFELEALGSLANLAYLNPDYTLPAVAGGDSREPIFEAEQIGHPLLQDRERVSNDFSVAGLGDISIITGSNMAGKSTFLRTVGVNLALAYAGGPVNARRLQTSLFRLFTCIKVTDSVTNGISYFYAEVKRLRALLSALEADEPLPLFFFIDEIFRGTNNRERYIGSKAYVQTLTGQHGVGLISTHDLELAKLADQVPTIDNYHFRDDIDGEQMVFDYQLHAGPCPTTNALKIMQLEGLPVK